MRHHIAAAPLALLLATGTTLAQDDPQTVGISVEGAVVEVALALAAEACGMDSAALLAEWKALGADIETMADTSVAADATDLAPEVAVDTPMDSTLDGVSVSDGADATHDVDGGAAPDLASDDGAGTVSEVDLTAADSEAGPTPGVPADGTMDAGAEVASLGAGDGSGTGGGPATPTEGTGLSKAAVCEISRATADSLGIVAAR